MNTLFLGIITLASVVGLVVLIFVMIELRKTIKKLGEFITTTETSLKPTLEELPYTVRNIRHITDNVATVTDDIKVLAVSVRQAGENIHRASGYIEAATSTSVVHMSGLKAGIRAGIGVLIRNVVSKQKKQIHRR